MTKYKSGDIVHVRLADCDAAHLNEYGSTGVSASNIIAHIPAPEPVVRWINVYDDVTFDHESFESAKRNLANSGISYLFTARLEWPDGDTSNKPFVTIEEV